MSPSLIVGFTFGFLVLLSFAANRRLAGHSRLPMQWSWRGEVTWTAPRPLALAFTPILATVALGWALVDGGHRPDAGWPLIWIAGAFLCAHLLHLALMLRQGKAD